MKMVFTHATYNTSSIQPPSSFQNANELSRNGCRVKFLRKRDYFVHVKCFVQVKDSVWRRDRECDSCCFTVSSLPFIELSQLFHCVCVCVCVCLFVSFDEIIVLYYTLCSTLVVAVGFHWFIVKYREPNSRFGRNVRLHAWDPPRSGWHLQCPWAAFACAAL